MVYSAIYCSATGVYTKTGLSATEFDITTNDSQLLSEADAELELITGRKFTDAVAVTEYIDIGRMDILENKQATFLLGNYPIQSITSMLELDMDGDTTYTFDTLSAANIVAGIYQTDDYWLDTKEESLASTIIPTGKVILKTRALSAQTAKVKVVYTYGYSTVPASVTTLGNVLASIRMWKRVMSACYNRANNYGVPSQNVDKGDFYARAKMNLDLLEEEKNGLLDRIGRRSRVLFGSTGSSR